VRVGGRIAEAYPAVTLKVFGCFCRGYKQPDALDIRHEIVTCVARKGHLTLCAETIARCVASDHCLDALVCALVARATAVRLTRPVPTGFDPAVIDREGGSKFPSRTHLNASPRRPPGPRESVRLTKQ
jgi:predicted RNase H-like nuclease